MHGRTSHNSLREPPRVYRRKTNPPPPPPGLPGHLGDRVLNSKYPKP